MKKQTKQCDHLCVYVFTEYFDVLIVNNVFADPAPYTSALSALPEDMSAQFNKPEKEEVVTSFLSWFTPKGVSS